MKRVLIALLVTATVAALVLAVGLARTKTNVPPSVHRFVEAAWSRSGPVAIERYTSPEFHAYAGIARFDELMKRYSHQMGAFTGIVEDRGRSVNELGVMEVDLVLGFEKGNADARVRLVRPVTGRTWFVERFRLDIPPELESPRSFLPTNLNARTAVEDYTVGFGSALWVLFDEQLQLSYGEPRAFAIEAFEFKKRMGGVPREGITLVEEPTRLGEDEVRIRWRVEGSEATAEIDQLWRFHDVFWSVTKQTVTFEGD